MASVKVMKGVPFTEERLKKWLAEDGEVLVQTKRDEFRCTVNIIEPHHLHDDEVKVTYSSASGKPLHNIHKAFDALFLMMYQEYGLTEFDCGVSVNDSFDLTRRVLKASKKVYDCRGREVYRIEDGPKKAPELVYEGTLSLAFWLYDLPEMSDTPFSARLETMRDLARLAGNSVFVPETVTATSLAEVYEHFGCMVAADFEGSMVKRVDFRYVYSRTVDWMKLKPEAEADGKITGYTEGKGEFEGLIGSLELTCEDGSTTAISGITLELRKAISANREKYLGQWVEFKYMQRDSAGGYRHPRFFRFHPDK
ncbi:ATP-dependent DNA ligase [Pectobacterium phage PP2]|uniref:DNA ligase n=1 Tax=Pectobacterium phage PP2 TaxID=1897743 RepID=A0A1W5P504_9CAUD|nr:ATP-dependent DNA ligase [Pectobacterium phage PP2]AOT25383.1 ATP-dependent DNA ligase [Pectobacterium phage PP2]